MCVSGFFLGLFQLAYGTLELPYGSQVAEGHFLARRASPLGGSGAMLPRKILKFDVAKTAIFKYFYAFSSAFFLSTVP